MPWWAQYKFVADAVRETLPESEAELPELGTEPLVPELLEPEPLESEPVVPEQLVPEAELEATVCPQESAKDQAESKDPPMTAECMLEITKFVQDKEDRDIKIVLSEDKTV